jgi:CelD/BcsL family acetyltransferase involved in cellulose biosynthesis
MENRALKSNLYWRWIRTPEEFRILQATWDQAVRKSGNSPFLSWKFIDKWLKIFDFSESMAIFAIFRDGSIIGGLPLYFSRSLFFRTLLHVGGSFANLTEPFCIEGQDVFESNFKEALNSLDGWDFLRLDYIKISVSFSLFRMPVRIKDVGSNPLIILTDSAQIHVNKVGGSLRRNIKRYWNGKKCNKFKKKFVVANSIEESRRLIQDHINFSKISQNLRGRRSGFEDERWRQFLWAMNEIWFEEGRFQIFAVSLNQRTAAVAIGCLDVKKFKWLFTSYNPEFSQFCPGHGLTYELINYLHSIGVCSVDLFAGKSSSFKDKWANRWQSIRSIRIFNVTHLGRLALSLFDLRQRLVECVND